MVHNALVSVFFVERDELVSVLVLVVGCFVYVEHGDEAELLHGREHGASDSHALVLLFDCKRLEVVYHWDVFDWDEECDCDNVVLCVFCGGMGMGWVRVCGLGVLAHGWGGGSPGLYMTNAWEACLEST